MHAWKQHKRQLLPHINTSCFGTSVTHKSPWSEPSLSLAGRPHAVVLRRGSLGGRWSSGTAKCSKAPTTTAKGSKAARGLLSRCSEGVGLPLCQAPKAACHHQSPLSTCTLALCAPTNMHWQHEREACIMQVEQSMAVSAAAYGSDLQ